MQPRLLSAAVAAGARSWLKHSSAPAVSLRETLPLPAQDMAFALAEFQEMPASPSLQPAQVSLGGRPALQCTGWSPWSGVIHELDKSALMVPLIETGQVPRTEIRLACVPQVVLLAFSKDGWKICLPPVSGHLPCSPRPSKGDAALTRAAASTVSSLGCSPPGPMDTYGLSSLKVPGLILTRSWSSPPPTLPLS